MSSTSSYDERTQLLLRAAQAGDRPALDELFDRVEPMLLSWAHLRMSPAFRQKVDPRDVVQEVWLRAMERFERMDPRTPRFRAWIFRVAHFVLIEMSREYLRSGARRPGASSLLATHPSPETGVSTRLGRQDAVLTLVDVAGGETRENRELVVLRGLEGCSFDDIARRLGGKPAAWEKRWQRLRARIQIIGIPEYLS